MYVRQVYLEWLKFNKWRKAGCIIILIMMIGIMLCIWPICLVRRDTELATGPTDYIETEEAIQGGEAMEQFFTAQAGVLYKLSFVVGYEEELPEEGYIHFTLKETESGNVLREKDVSFSQLNDGGYSDVDVNQHIKKGREYSYSLTVQEKYAELFKGFYSSETGMAPAGSGRLLLNGEMIEGQAVSRYDYGMPLNVKNVVCIWAFILIIGFLLLHNIGMPLPEWKKLDGLLEKFQMPLLIGVIIAVTALIIRICFNEAVDWDEAFTWQLITKNNIKGIIEGTAADVHPPLYYLIAKAAISLFGKKIFVVKMTSVAAAVGSMVLLATVFRKYFGVKAALLLIPIIGLGPQFIYYNVDCRMYSLMIFFVLGAALFAYGITLEDKPAQWVFFTLFSLGGVYTQYFAVIPLAFLYLYLFIWILREKRTEWKKWLICCAATVAGYVPWLKVVLAMMKSENAGTGQEINFSLMDFLGTIFQTNIEFSALMPFILFLVCILALGLGWKQYNRTQKGFLVVSGCLLWLTEFLCILIARRMSHFWSERYIVDAIIFVWIFIAVIISRQGTAVWIFSCIWTGIMVLSSYTIMKARELDTVPWTQNARQVLAEVQDESVILYNYSTYDVLYEYYMPNAEFVWMDEMDFSQWPRDYIYMIGWGGADFCDEIKDKYYISQEYMGTFRLEEGVGGVALIKVHFQEK